MTGDSWTARLHTVSSTISWCCALNAMWLGFTVAGGVVFGIGPATVTACILARRRMRGETIHFRDFATTWRRELIRGTVVVLPVVLLVTVLWSNYTFFTTLGDSAGAARLVTLAACLVAIAVATYVGPLYAHYQLPLHAYLRQASRMALARPASTVLLLAVFVTVAFITAAVPVLLLTVSVGVWLQTSTWLCVRFFEENERRLADATANPAPAAPAGAGGLVGAAAGRTRPPLGLPTEPLRLR